MGGRRARDKFGTGRAFASVEGNVIFTITTQIVLRPKHGELPTTKGLEIPPKFSVWGFWAGGVLVKFRFRRIHNNNPLYFS